MKSLFWLVVFALVVALGSQTLNAVMTALTVNGAHVLR